MFLSSEHIINRLMILFLCMRVYLIYHFNYLIVLFTVKWAYSGFLAIQFLVTLFILARKLTEIQWFFTVRCLSVGKNFKTWLFLVMTLLVTVTDKCRPVLVFFQRWLYMYVLGQTKFLHLLLIVLAFLVVFVKLIGNHSIYHQCPQTTLTAVQVCCSFFKWNSNSFSSQFQY